MADYLSETTFKLKIAGLMGKEVITLPVGEKVTTANVRVFFELDEAIDWLAYTLEYLSKYSELEKQLTGLPSDPESTHQPF